MLLNQKAHYALQALVELAKRQGQGPIKISDISKAQYIPHRFLEVILSQLKRTGLVASKRGYYGGYTLTRSPNNITVGDILRFLQKPTPPDQCLACNPKSECPFGGKCAFLPMWKEIKTAVFEIYDRTTIQDLVAYEDRLKDM